MTDAIAVIFAGGVGDRMGSPVPKQFLEVAGKPIIAHTLEPFQRHPRIHAIYIACLPAAMDKMQAIVDDFGLDKVKRIVPGGATGQDSIYNGLTAAKDNGESDQSIVLIHDGVRPYISTDLLDANIECVERYGSAVTCTPASETVITSADGLTIDDVSLRKNTFTAQAPQSFRLGDILSAHEALRKVNPGYVDIVDSCTLFRNLGKPVHIVMGTMGNLKITYQEDYYTFQALLKFQADKAASGGQTAAIPVQGAASQQSAPAPTQAVARA
jgi:2-C-methyl-D-erythritol 4-phosphate cytidylyltransferase